MIFNLSTIVVSSLPIEDAGFAATGTCTAATGTCTAAAGTFTAADGIGGSVVSGDGIAVGVVPWLAGPLTTGPEMTFAAGVEGPDIIEGWFGVATGTVGAVGVMCFVGAFGAKPTLLKILKML
jgi:hypothetical protein